MHNLSNPYSFRELRLRYLLIIAIPFLMALVQGCSKEVSTDPLNLKPPETFSNSGSDQQPDEWWKSFDDEELDQMIIYALDSNYTLESAWQRVLAARAVVKRERSGLFPELSGNVRSAISRPTPDFVGGENIQFGMQAGYEIDLWGRIRAATDAERYRTQASIYDYRTTAISITADIAATRMQLIAANNQLELIRSQVETNENILKLIRSRIGTGEITAVDVLRQEQLIESTRQQLYNWQTNVGLLEHQMALLLGKSPHEKLDAEFSSFPKMPDLPQTGVPADLINRRPDVQASFARLKATDRELAAAISSQYPRLTLNTNLAFRTNDFSNLLDSWAYSLAGNLLAPLFYGGRLRAEVDRTTAVKEQQLYEYGQVVLGAFRDVEDAIVQENNQRETVESIEKQVESAENVSKQLRARYFNGMTNYLDVLTALNEVQQLKRDLIVAKRGLLLTRISLYRALAGSFETNRQLDD